jgi:hypothetical protein
VTTHLELEHDVIFFDTGDFKVSRAEEVDKIHAAAKFLSWMSSDVDGIVKGHASGEGNAQFNEDLSEQRANTVRDLLQALGVVNLPLTAVGVGSKEPAVPETAKTPDDLEAQRQQNRRVEIIVTTNPAATQQPQPPATPNIWRRIDDIPEPGPMYQRRLKVPRRLRKPDEKDLPDVNKWLKDHHIDPKTIGNLLGKFFKEYEDKPDDDSPGAGGDDDD